MTAKKPSEIVAQQMPDIRKRQQLTQEMLAKRLDALGVRMDRATVAKIEAGRRGISLDEALALAVALNVSPVNLFLPVREKTDVAITPELPVDSGTARQWVRGREALRGQDERAFRAEVPDAELAVNQSLEMRVIVRGIGELFAATKVGDRDEVHAAVDQLKAELDRVTTKGLLDGVVPDVGELLDEAGYPDEAVSEGLQGDRR